MNIACLHTIASNADIFAAVCPPGVTLSHTIRPDLLTRAEAQGGLTAEIRDEAAALLRELAKGADAVLLTCSTVGPAAEAAGQGSAVPILRVDAALAQAAVASGKPVLVLCAVATTVEPSRRLFEAAAMATGATIEMRVVDSAWDQFKAGNLAEYSHLVADAADAAFANGQGVVALAQASMAGAVALSRRGTPLASPQMGIAAALAATVQ